MAIKNNNFQMKVVIWILGIIFLLLGALLQQITVANDVANIGYKKLCIGSIFLEIICFSCFYFVFKISNRWMKGLAILGLAASILTIFSAFERLFKIW